MGVQPLPTRSDHLGDAPTGHASRFDASGATNVNHRHRSGHLELGSGQVAARAPCHHAEAFLGEDVERAVITCPVYFDDNQRSATKDAAAIAGLEVARLVNEPTTASVAYGRDRLGQELRIAVIDFGGGTLDVTIMEFGKGVFEVKSTSEDARESGALPRSITVATRRAAPRRV
jgi:hypothetical protein